MNFFERAKIAWDVLRRVGGIELPDAGRSSDPSLGAGIGFALSKYSSISPVVNFEALELLEKYAIFNPDVSQFCDNIINLANTGHNVQIDAKSETAAETAVNRLNETASRLYRNGAGVDGLINMMIFQIAWSGALSAEDVVNFAGRRVEQTVLVPVKQIRFKYDEDLGEFVPFQRSNNLARNVSRDELGMIRLHPETYRYYALKTFENFPYAIPPASAAIETICESQKPIMENIAYIAQKFGLLGLFSAAVTPPPKNPGETQAEYQRRAQEYLAQVRKALVSRIRDGLLVAFRDQKIEHTNIAEGATGVYDINRISEEQVMSGLSMTPAFFGRTDSTTETYADVLYSVLSAKVHNVQMLPKRRMEQTYRLDLRLGGIDVDGISLKFSRTFSRNILEENTAAQQKWETVLGKVQNGFLSPTEGAQELGKEEWFDEDLIGGEGGATLGQLQRKHKKVETFSFRFKKDAQRYEFVRPQIVLSGAVEESETSAGNVIPIKKKALAALN